jgi:hypothetical protein
VLEAIIATVIGPLDLARIAESALDLRRHLLDPRRRRKRQLEGLTPPRYQG